MNNVSRYSFTRAPILQSLKPVAHIVCWKVFRAVHPKTGRARPMRISHQFFQSMRCYTHTCNNFFKKRLLQSRKFPERCTPKRVTHFPERCTPKRVTHFPVRCTPKRVTHFPERCTPKKVTHFPERCTPKRVTHFQQCHCIRNVND